MAMKYLLLAIVAIITIQGTVESKAISNNDSLQETVKEIINEIKQVIQMTKDDATIQLQNSIDQITKKGQEAINESMLNFKHILNNMIGEIEQLKKDAEELGINVTECIRDYKNQLDDLSISIENLMTETTNNKIAHSRGMIHLTIGLMNESIKDVEKLEERAKECTEQSNSACLEKIIKDGKDLRLKLPNFLNYYLQRSISLIARYSDELVIILPQQLELATNNANTILNEVSECIRKTIEEEIVNMIV